VVQRIDYDGSETVRIVTDEELRHMQNIVSLTDVTPVVRQLVVYDKLNDEELPIVSCQSTSSIYEDSTVTLTVNLGPNGVYYGTDED